MEFKKINLLEMKVKILIVSFIAVVLVLSVGIYFFIFYPGKSVEENYLVEDKSISSTPDSIIKFFSFVTSSWFDDKSARLYFSDRDAGCIAIFDTNLNFLDRVGKKGKGPGEFEMIDCVRGFNKLIFIYDVGWIKVLGIDDGRARYLSSFRIPWFPGNKFSVNSYGNLIVPASAEVDSALAVYDTMGRVLKFFCSKINQGTKQRTFLKNGIWPVVDEEGNIYVVFLSLPYIRKYSTDYKLLIERRLSDEVKYGLKIIEKNEKQNPNVRWYMVGGVYYRKPYLYVSYASKKPTIYVYDDKTLKLRKKLKIKDEGRVVGHNFTVISDNNIVFYDMKTGGIVKYVKYVKYKVVK